MSAGRAGDTNEKTKSPPEDAKVVSVALGKRTYDVLIGGGLLARAAQLIETRIGPARCMIVTDENVAQRHLAALENALKQLGRHAATHIVAPGESSKSFAVLAGLCERILESGLERGGLVIALGGGVVGDLAGFAASIVRRGVGFVQIPTTLLAQVDSSVGGKTGIDMPQGKNLIGTFYQPSLVLADIRLLCTLPEREFRAGYVEAAKYGLLGDAAFFNWLEQNYRMIFVHDSAALARVVETSVAGKAAIVARDETETGDRMLLNLGHTFGHALEAWAGYSQRLLHGEAVAIGICLAFQLSQELGLTDHATVHRVAAHLRAAGLPTRVADIPGEETPDATALVKIMGQDKKVKDGKLTLILVRGIGKALVSRDVAAETIHAFLTRQLAARRD
jgi:shikimate kinase/3-dehydroquinate synthase